MQAGTFTAVNTNAATLLDGKILTAELLTSKQVAELFSKSHKTIERYAREGAIPAHFRFGSWYFVRSELDAWLQADLHSNSQNCRVN